MLGEKLSFRNFGTFLPKRKSEKPEECSLIFPAIIHTGSIQYQIITIIIQKHTYVKFYVILTSLELAKVGQITSFSQYGYFASVADTRNVQWKLSHRLNSIHH
jgi:hypothetical protein